MDNYVITNENERYLKVQKILQDSSRENKYLFTLNPRELDEFFAMCYYHQTSHESSFLKNRICSVKTSNGSITITGNKFVKIVDGQRKEIEIQQESDFELKLHKYFGIIL